MSGIVLLAPLPVIAQDLVRDAKIRGTFQRQVPCPANQLPIGPCPGYEVTYVRSLCSGGSRSVGNLKWQALAPVRPGDLAKSEDPLTPQTVIAEEPCN